jgi:hypothetical protein
MGYLFTHQLTCVQASEHWDWIEKSYMEEEFFRNEYWIYMLHPFIRKTHANL